MRLKQFSEQKEIIIVFREHTHGIEQINSTQGNISKQRWLSTFIVLYVDDKTLIDTNIII